jgi:hypothetical protein
VLGCAHCPPAFILITAIEQVQEASRRGRLDCVKAEASTGRRERGTNSIWFFGEHVASPSSRRGNGDLQIMPFPHDSTRYVVATWQHAIRISLFRCRCASSFIFCTRVDLLWGCFSVIRSNNRPSRCRWRNHSPSPGSPPQRSTTASSRQIYFLRQARAFSSFPGWCLILLRRQRAWGCLCTIY